jgi:hypothetical protein
MLRALVVPALCVLAALAAPAAASAIPQDTEAAIVDGWRLGLDARYDGATSVTCPDGTTGTTTTTIVWTGTGNASGLPLVAHHSVALPPGRSSTTRVGGTTRYGQTRTRTACGASEGPASQPPVAAFSTTVSIRFALAAGRLWAHVRLDAAAPLGPIRASADASVPAAAARRAGGTRIVVAGRAPVATQPGDDRGGGDAHWTLSIPVRLVDSRALLRFHADRTAATRGARSYVHLRLPNVGAPAPIRGTVVLRRDGELVGTVPLFMHTQDSETTARVTISRAMRALLGRRGSAAVDVAVDARYAHGGARRTSRTSTRLVLAR